jgi:DNA end-binding protein Ku
MARQLIESLAADFEPEKYEDTYRGRVLDLIERKASGDAEIVTAPEPVAAERVVDLMAALEASVAAAKDARKRHPTARADEAEPSGESPAEAPAAAAAKPAKKPAKKRKSA